MTKACDHSSVGVLVWKDEKFLLIERAKFPFGFAIPAGHVDGDPSFEVSAKRELEEEVGLKAEKTGISSWGRKNNVCRRENGTWHYWKLYETQVSGNLVKSEDETKIAN